MTEVFKDWWRVAHRPEGDVQVHWTIVKDVGVASGRDLFTLLMTTDACPDEQVASRYDWHLLESAAWRFEKGGDLLPIPLDPGEEPLYLRLHSNGEVSEWMEVPYEGFTELGLDTAGRAALVATLQTLEATGASSISFEMAQGFETEYSRSEQP